jgi:hypothetical protein
LRPLHAICARLHRSGTTRHNRGIELCATSH